MCTRLSCPPPPECETFATIRAALEACEPPKPAGSLSVPRPARFVGESRVAYVVASLRASSNPDCHKAADFIMRLCQVQS